MYGTKDRLRMNVYRSNNHLYVQLIDDEKGHTIVSAGDNELKAKTGKRTEKAFQVGEMLAEKALKLKIKKAVFDKNGYKYHGIVKAVADGARKSGLEF